MKVEATKVTKQSYEAATKKLTELVTWAIVDRENLKKAHANEIARLKEAHKAELEATEKNSIIKLMNLEAYRKKVGSMYKLGLDFNLNELKKRRRAPYEL